MASFTYTAGDTWLTITVRGLSSGQRVRYYVRRNPGTTSVIDEIYTSSGISLTKTFDGLIQNTDYAANAGIVTGNGTDWIGAQYFTTKSSSGGGGDVPEPTRPRDWSWWSTIRSGAKISISASEWNNFCDRINEFREYEGLSTYGFDYVYRGDPISAHIVNQARNAIRDMTSRFVPGSVMSGDTICASFFLDLQDALNSIS